MARPCCETAPGDAGKTFNRGKDRIVIHLAGNPNAGKTTLFNRLTGARQRTGNWPGVTVERREGSFRDEAGEILVIDLPGVYSLSGGGEGLDERIAREAISDSDHDVIVDIVDASNLERNLYLTVQLAEARQPMVVALNMIDVAEAAGRPVDAQALQERLGVPVVAMNARKGEGVRELVAAVREAAEKRLIPRPEAPWPPPLARAITELEDMVKETPAANEAPARWLAIRLLENDPDAQAKVPEPVLSRAARLRARIMKALKEVPDLAMADARYDLAHELAAAALPRREATPRRGFSELFDKMALHPVSGPLVFLLAMYLLFMLTINLGGAFVDFFDILGGAVFVDGVRALLAAAGAPAWLVALLADGVGTGIQTVGTFIPIIGFLFLALTFLEDSGYMARAAFLADTLMRAIGLPGKAFVPLIVGFGCNVPAVMAARTLENPRDRIATILMTPFMSCGARLTVFALFAAAFFGGRGQNVVFALYLIGIAAAILTGLLMKSTILKGESLPFIMELPPYRLPSPRNLVLHAWMRLKGFVFGAGKIIVIVVTVLGLVNSLGTDGSFGNQHTEKSLLSAIGKEITPLFAPIGIRRDNWPATVGLFTGVFAKEVVVGTLNALYAGLEQPQAAGAAAAPDFVARVKEALASVPANLAGLKDLLSDPLGLGDVGSKEEVALSQGVETVVFGAMSKRFDGRVDAFAYMLFVLLYFPCLATFGAIAREAGLRWALLAGAWNTWLAFFASIGFYQAATFARHPQASAVWLLALALVMGIVVYAFRRAGDYPAGGRLAAAE